MKHGYIIIFQRAKNNKKKKVLSRENLSKKRAKNGPSARKIMATIFWDSHGIILIDYLEKGKIIR